MSVWKLCCCSEDDRTRNSNTLVVARRKSVPSIASRQIERKQSIVVEKKDRYEGEQFQGKPHGNGAMIYANGDYFRGEWVNGIKEGRGLQIYNDTDSKYEGEWKNNLANGHGKLILKSGSYFVGDFKDGQKNGKGQFHDFEQKETYIDVYENGARIKRELMQTRKSKEEEFPTLVLDKERFNSQDLIRFEEANPEIKEFGLEFLLKYYGLCKVIHLEFIDTNISEWTIKQVLTFLTEIGLKQYQDTFYKNKVKGKDLLTLQQTEMKEDLKMKLGDRKRLANYIRYLESIYRPKKQKTLKNNTMRRKKSPKNLIISNKIMARQLHSIQNPIRQESDEEWNNDSPTYITETDLGNREGRSKNRIHNFATEDWDKYNSNVHQGLHSLDDRQRTSTQKSGGKSPGEVSNISHRISQDQDAEDQKVMEESSLAFRKQSQDKKSDEHNHHRERERDRQKDNKKERKSSSSSSDSSSSESEQLSTLKKHKSKSKSHTVQIRELCEFLKEHTGLDFLIKPKDIEIQEQIGEGGYGKVYKGKYISCPVAIKDYLKAGRVHKSRQDFMKEVDVLSDLKHPNIVLYMGMCITADKYQLITEYLDNGSLYDQIHKKKKKFTNTEKYEFVREIVKGMVYLHNMKNMLHRDLKSSNVLLSEDWKVKLCDFGLSGHKKKTKKKKHRMGTYQWMAPEVIRNEEIDFASDVYSFGVVIWEILAESIPYQGYTEPQIIGTVGYDENHRLESPSDGDPLLVDLMEKCLKRNPESRPTFIEIQEEFNVIEERKLKGSKLDESH